MPIFLNFLIIPLRFLAEKTARRICNLGKEYLGFLRRNKIMSHHRRKTQKTKVDLQTLTIVTFTDDMELAKEYETLLKNNDIPELTKSEYFLLKP